MTKRITNADKQNEAYVASILKKEFQCDVHLSDDMEVYDFLLSDDDIPIAIVELKCRNISPNQYDTIYLSKDKRNELESLAEECAISPIFMVKFDDNSIKMIELGKDKDFGNPKRLGRFDRGDKKDVEWMYNVKIQDMSDV